MRPPEPHAALRPSRSIYEMVWRIVEEPGAPPRVVRQVGNGTLWAHDDRPQKYCIYVQYTRDYPEPSSRSVGVSHYVRYQATYGPIAEVIIRSQRMHDSLDIRHTFTPVKSDAELPPLFC